MSRIKTIQTLVPLFLIFILMNVLVVVAQQGDAAGTTYTVPNVTANCAMVFSFAALPSAASIPTLGEWGLIILSGLMGLFVVGMRRRRML